MPKIATDAPDRVGYVARKKFIAPLRDGLDAGFFDAALFDGFRRHDAWLRCAEWPSLDELNAALGGAIHPQSGASLTFVAQTPALLADGLHYEQRIFERGEIATRERNWHDLFNALMWIERRPLKAALNARQMADVAVAGASERTRAQCALTHFDEGGAIVVLRDAGLLEAWNSHDWHALFYGQRDAWRDGRAHVIVFGHALLEHALQADPIHTAKCVAVLLDAPDDSPHSDASIIENVADAIAKGDLMQDPQELRPLPLSGIPGWYRGAQDVEFYRTADCFRPLRAGRVYPAALRFETNK
jgi:hypothetical protein